MRTPLVSVIVPVYNQEQWIGRCLRSLMNQTLSRSNYEIIVIDDGSEDRTPFALDLFKDEIVLIKNENNLQKIWTEEKYKDPCSEYNIPYYLAYIYYYYKNQPNEAALYYKIASAIEDGLS